MSFFLLLYWWVLGNFGKNNNIPYYRKPPLYRCWNESLESNKKSREGLAIYLYSWLCG